MRIIQFFTLFLLFTTSTIFGQYGSIEGKIIDENDAPIEYVNILLLLKSDSSLVKGNVTDSLGHYLIEDVSPGEYFITASLVGYKDVQSTTFTITNGKEYSVELLKFEGGQQLDEIVVTAVRPFMELKADKVIINVANSSVAGGNSALEVLRKAPGIFIDKDNNISLKGKQGIQIMINGRLQYMSTADIARMLENMPAESIDNIEIIMNPTAKYDAEGNAGIINIKLLKDENLGLNGRTNAGARKGRTEVFNAGLNLNYRASKTNFYGSYYINRWANWNSLNLDRTVSFNGLETDFNQNRIETRKGLGHDVKVGMDYTLSEKTTLGVLLKTNVGGQEKTGFNQTTIAGGNAPGYSNLNVDIDDDNDFGQYAANLNLKHDFDKEGTSLVFDFDFSNYTTPSSIVYASSYLNSEEVEVLPTSFLRNDFETGINIFASKLDFTKQFKFFGFESGLKYSSVSTENKTVFENLIEDVWIVDGGRTNTFMYDEDVFAAYVNGSKSLGLWNIQVGLRGENTHSVGNSVTLNQVVSRNYFNLFPSVALSHMINKKHSLSYSYSRRLNRPNYQSLNPFENFLDQYTFLRGNPFLQPQYSNNFNVNYGLGNKLFISLAYSRTTDAISEIIEQDASSNITYQTNANLDDFTNYGVNISAPINVADFWTTRISLNAFYNDFKSELAESTLDAGRASFQTNINNSITLPGKISMELSGNYQSGVVYGQIVIKPQYGVDLGFTKTVLNGKGQVRLSATDLFATNRFQGSVNQGDIDLTIVNRWDSRRLALNFNYRFGNDKVKQARKRSTSLESEEQRINKSNG